MLWLTLYLLETYVEAELKLQKLFDTPHVWSCLESGDDDTSLRKLIDNDLRQKTLQNEGRKLATLFDSSSTESPSAKNDSELFLLIVFETDIFLQVVVHSVGIQQKKSSKRKRPILKKTSSSKKPGYLQTFQQGFICLYTYSNILIISRNITSFHRFRINIR